MSSQSLSAIVVGYTGVCGKELVRVLAGTPAFARVSLLGRREIQLPDEVASSGKFEQKRIDFDALDANPESQSELFVGHDVIFCCIGTTRARAGYDGFVKVDHDYAMAVAKACKAAGVKQFHQLSAVGAKPNSFLFTLRIKGQVEEELASLGFDRLAIYRPKLVVAKHDDGPAIESIALVLSKPFQWLAPTLLTTPLTTLAQAMVNSALAGGTKRDVYCNAAIFQRAAESG